MSLDVTLLISVCHLCVLSYGRYFSLLSVEKNNANLFFFQINNPLLAQLYVEALGKKLLKGDLKGYQEGRIPSEVKSWSEWVGGRV